MKLRSFLQKKKKIYRLKSEHSLKKYQLTNIKYMHTDVYTVYKADDILMKERSKINKLLIGRENSACHDSWPSNGNQRSVFSFFGLL